MENERCKRAAVVNEVSELPRLEALNLNIVVADYKDYSKCMQLGLKMGIFWGAYDACFITLPGIESANNQQVVNSPIHAN